MMPADYLHIGDCAEILPNLGIRPQLILTSPPYDNLRVYGNHGFDFARVADALVAVMPEGGVLVWVVADATIDGSETGTSFRQALGFMERGLKLHDTMIWQKIDAATSWTPKRYDQEFEYMFVLSNGEPSVANIIADRRNLSYGDFSIRQASTRRGKDGELKRVSGRPVPGKFGRRRNIWGYLSTGLRATDEIGREHPATFPYSLAADHIRTWTNPGDLVLDPMAGSGTTLRAAKDLQRQYIGIEIHEPYGDIIRQRMAQEVLDLAVT